MPTISRLEVLKFLAIPKGETTTRMPETTSEPGYKSSTGLQDYQIALMFIGGVVLLLIIIYICVRIYKFNYQQSHASNNNKVDIPKFFKTLGTGMQKIKTRKNIGRVTHEENHTISNFNENQISINDKSSSLEQTIETKVARTTLIDSFHLELSTLTNQGKSLELIKLVDDENINYLIFPDIAKKYLFNMDELEYLGSEGNF